MANESGGRLPHIFIKDTATTDRYTRPARGYDAKFWLPHRSRRGHAKHFLTPGIETDIYTSIVEKFVRLLTLIFNDAVLENSILRKHEM